MSIDEVNVKIEELSRKVDIILASLEKLNVHIDFVEEVYESLRHPFRRLTGIETKKNNNRINLN